MRHVAHIREDQSEQLLSEHLKGTARRASNFAKVFDAGEEAYRIGLVHDQGKYSKEFQEYIRGTGISPDHATAGAQTLFAQEDFAGVFAVAGHHGGLPDGGAKGDTEGPTLMGRMKKKVFPCPDFHREISLPDFLPDGRVKGDPFAQSVYIRMLFSCLVDADFLDTEWFMKDGQVDRGDYGSFDFFWECLHRDHKNKVRANSKILPRRNRWLNSLRNEIYDACVKGAEQSPGLFTLTVPTGGGKTLSSLAFALRHALCHGLTRIIYVIPYTSIIEQTAQVFRDIVGEQNVLEHHSQAVADSGEDSPEAVRRRLASENWDAPIVVTTNVQFFESFYDNRPSRCRKVHRMANSVIIFDEVQELPPPHLIPCLKAIESLVRDYRTTAVLCTATQPAFDRFFPADMQPRELCPQSRELYLSLQRTTLRWIGKRTPDQLAERLAKREQVLVIVNTRKEAGELFDRLRAQIPEGRYHLSTLMTPEHRQIVLEEIRQRLKDGLPCRVVSTSLLEAGVDVEFPRVYRAEAGLTSILQAAGRCNREGNRSAAQSPVWVFRGETAPPPLIAQQTALFHEIRSAFADWSSPEAVRAYTQSLFDFKGDCLDRDRILDAFYKGRRGCTFPFAQVAKEFRLIDVPTRSVFVPPESDPDGITEQLLAGLQTQSLLRRAGRHMVSVYPGHFRRLVENGAVQAMDGEWGILREPSLYDPEKGLSLEWDEGQALFV